MIQKKYWLFLSMALTILFSSCKKDTTANVSTKLKVPVISFVGDPYVSVEVGSTYTDAGATYFAEDGTESTIQASVNEVNTAVPGIYFVTYEQTSASGIFHTEETRVVAVAYRGNTVDYSGNYLRAATGVSAFVTRLAPGLYRVQNPGGAAGHEVVSVYFIETAANVFAGPLQPNPYVGDIEITDITFSDTGASWRIPSNAYYGTGLRTFTKQ